MSPGAKKEIDAAKAAIIGLLMAGNIFFVNRLVDKVDRTGDEVGDVRLEFVEMKSQLNGIKNEVAGIRRILRERAGYKDAAYCRENPMLKSHVLKACFI